VEHVLIRYPQYHEAVQARIEARNIQEQTKQKNIEEARLAEALGALKEVEKQGEANLSIKLMEGSNYVTRLTAQMDSYRRKKVSEANRVMALAEAEKQRMVNMPTKVKAPSGLSVFNGPKFSMASIPSFSNPAGPTASTHSISTL
jgi:regulator of protease activity HflC (stomatin/prohibitin superfamily)